MIKSGYFEVGTIIVLENESDFDICREKLDKTIGNLIEQEVKPIRVGIMATGCDISIKDIKKYIDNISARLYKKGVMHLDFTKCLENKATFRKKISNEFLGFINKAMPIILKNTKGEEKKSSLRVSHFSIINAGYCFDSKKYYSAIKKDFIEGKKSLVIYSNLITQDGEKMTINASDLTDKFPVTYFSYGFKHFIIGGGEGYVMDIYREINRERKKIKRDDEYFNEIEDGSYNDYVFLKSKGSILI